MIVDSTRVAERQRDAAAVRGGGGGGGGRRAAYQVQPAAKEPNFAGEEIQTSVERYFEDVADRKWKGRNPRLFHTMQM